MFYRNGMIYFVNMCSSNNKMYLPRDILNLIFDCYHDVDQLTCMMCGKMLIDFNVNMLHNDVENYSIMNGYAKCYTCFID